jgi:hypothetical protein
VQPIWSAEEVHAAIAGALYVRPDVVMVGVTSDRQFVDTVFPGPRADTPVYVRRDEIVSSGFRPAHPHGGF